jgi:hypothetical protein
MTDFADWTDERKRDSTMRTEVAIPALPAGMTPEQILLTLGVMAYSPEYSAGTSFAVTLAFDRLVGLAVRRGFPRHERRRLKGNVRAAQVRGIALKRAAAVLALIAPEEFCGELRLVDFWVRQLPLHFARMRAGGTL